MIFIDGDDFGEVSQIRSCTSPEPAPRMLCKDIDEENRDPKHRVHCCYYNMCNDASQINITLPTVLPSTSHTGKGNFVVNRFDELSLQLTYIL